MIVIVDIGIGNIGSVKRALTFVGADFEVADEPAALENASKILFPGVGSFSAASSLLEEKPWKSALRDEVLIRKKPILGICLGMQLLFTKGFEGKESIGLDLLKGSVVPLQIDASKYKIPHMGWNSIAGQDLTLYTGIPENSDFYFVHSFEVAPEDPSVQIAFTTYGEHKIPAMVQKDNIFGAQFHPEKSQKVGLQVLKNFVDLPC